MSVINKMLQDLEQRQQPAAVARPEPTAPLPPAAGKPRYLWLALLCMGLLTLGGLWQRQSGQAQAQGQTLVQPALPAAAAPATAKPATIQAVLSTEPATTNPPIPQQASASVPPVPLQTAAAGPDITADPMPAAQPPAVQPQATVDKQPLSAKAQQQNMQQRAAASEAAGDTSGAIVIWQQMVALQPTEPAGYLNLARLWLKQQQMVTASQVLSQARKNGVLSAEINMQLAQLAVRQGQWQQALQFLPDQFELAAEPEYFGFKATVLQQLQQYEAALSWYQRLVQLQPEQGRWSLGAALVSEQLGQPHQAWQYYQQAWQYRQALSASSHQFIQQRLKATEP